MKFTRREALALGLGATAVAMLPMRAAAAADDAIAAFTGGAEVGEGGVTLSAPEIAENGNTVPVSVDAPGAMSIMLIATGNPTARCCSVQLRPGGWQSICLDPDAACGHAGCCGDRQTG